MGHALQRVWHQTRLRPRLAGAVALGTLAYFVMPPLPSHPLGSTRALVAWDVGVGLYLALAWHLMSRRTSPGRIKKVANLQDGGAVAVLALTLAAALASLAAIVGELVGLPDPTLQDRGFHLLLAGVTIFVSWCFVHTMFAVHYAHEYYVDRRADAHPGLEFPGESSPDYLDFLYFSFVIGMTSQTSDVAVHARDMRRLVLVHGVVAFFFNVTLLGVTLNIVAGIIQQANGGRG